MESLTDDVLVDVLRRLPPRSQAVSRCVCSAWRALIDGDGMLRADLLPQSLDGLIICYHSDDGLPRAMLFARPGVGSDDYAIPRGALQDHCNGLLLFYRCVLNPATDRCATLPERVPTDRNPNHLVLEYEFLAFDPAVSPDYYEVVMVPYVVPPEPARSVNGEPGAIGSGGGAMLDSEWPPSPWVLTVFSSATGLWEERPFIRQGEPAGTVADLRTNWGRNWLDDGRAEYWRGALYVHCKTNFVMRISLADSMYRVIKPPRCFVGSQEFVIGRSKKGIYSAFLDDEYRLWIWILDESCHDQIEWKLIHDTGRGIAFPSPSFGRGPWILYDSESEEQDDDEVRLDQEFEWDSDDDDNNDSNNTILPIDDMADQERRKFVRVLVFHPHKEIVFFQISSSRVMAYHLSSSKLEDLGELLPVTLMSWQRRQYISNYFPYTSCYMGELPEEF